VGSGHGRPGGGLPRRRTRRLGRFDTATTTGVTAWVVLDKYRCDLGNRVRVGEIELRLAGEGRIGAIALEIAGWSYCGPGDPGSTVHVSPFEPRLLAALRQG